MRTHVRAAAMLLLVLTCGAGPLFGQATKFVITGTASQTAGTSQNLTIRADSAGQPAASYTGDKVLTFSGASSSPGPVTAPTITDKSGTDVPFGSSTTITFVNGTATVSAGSNGVMKLYAVETAVVSVTDGSIQSTGSDRLTVTVGSGSVDKFALALASPQTNNAAFTAPSTLTAQDSWGNTVSAFDASANPVAISVNSLSGTVVGLGSGGNNTLNQASNFVSGVADLSALGMRYVGLTGTGSFTATSSSPVKTGSSGSVTINPGTAQKLVITGSGTQTAGASQNPTITAKDTSGNTATSYTGSKSIVYSGASSSSSPVTAPTASTSGGSDQAFGSSVSITFTNGVATASGGSNGTLKLYKVETATIAVTDGSISSTGADRLSVTVSPGSLGKFAMALASPQTSGVAFTGTNTLTALDSWGNTVTTFNAQSNSVKVSPSLAGVVTGLGTSPADEIRKSSDFVNGVADLTALGMTYTGASGSGTFTATSAGPVATGTSNSITIGAGAATRLVITGQATQTAGASQNLTITAKDASNNTVATYTGGKTLTFSGANASTDPVTTPKVRNATGTDVAFGSPTAITFTNGVATVSSGNNGVLKLYRAETATIAVTDGSIGASGADRLTVIVSPEAIGKFSFIIASPQRNNVAFTGTNTLTAEDDWGNVVTTFSAATNPVTITVGGVTGTVLGLGSGGNNVLNQAGNFSSGVANLTALGMKYLGTSGTNAVFTATSTAPAKSGNSAVTTIQAGVERRFAISGSTSVAAGVANALTITAQDTTGNVATAYTGNKTLSFAGAASSPDSNAPTVTDRTGAERNFSVVPNTELTFTNGVATASGNGNGVMRLRKVETASIAVSDGTISTPPGGSLGVTVTPAGLGRFAVVLTSPQTNGTAFTGVNTITAVDSFGNTATTFNAAGNNVTITSAALSGTITGLGSGSTNVLNQAGDFASGVANVSNKMKFTGAVGTGTFTATSANNRTGTSGNVTINVGQATRLVISGNGSQVAGAAQSLTITAKDSSDNTVTTYTGNKSLVFSGSGPSPNPATSPTVSASNGTPVPFGIATTIAFTNGVATVSGANNGVLRLYRAGRDTIAVSDGSIGSGGTDRLVVTVSADALAKFVLTLTSPQQNGVAFTGTNTLTAQDAYGNTKTDFNPATDNVTISPLSGLSGTVSGLGSGGTNTLNQAADFASGIANLTGKMKYTGSVGTGLFTAASASSKVGTSENVQIVAGGATRLVIRVGIDSVTTLIAGGTKNLTITAKDASNNTVTTYTGSKTLTFSGADSSLSPALSPFVTNSAGTQTAFGAATGITFTNGVATVSGGNNGVMRLLRAQVATISATDGTISSSGTDRLTVTVSAAVLGKFALALTSPQTSGVAFTGTNTLTAQDDWGNTITSFDAAVTPVTLSVPLTGSITGLGTGSNNILNRSADFTGGIANLTALGMKFTGTVGSGVFTANGGGKTGQSQSVQIVAGGATRLVLRTAAGDSVTTMTAGTTRNLVITAKDASNNTVTTYAGTKALQFSGADSSTLPAVPPTVTSSGGTERPFGVSTNISFVNGIATVSGSNNGVLKLFRAQAATITVTDGTIGSSGNDRLAITVGPAALGKFTWSLTSPQVSGVAFSGTNTLSAQDDWGNAVTTFDASTNNVSLSPSLAGTITGLGTGSNNILNRSTDFAAGVANLTALGMRYTGVIGRGVFTATAAGKAGTSDSITVTAGTATRLVITGAATQTAGTAQNLTITARDASNNVVAGYTGVKTLTFSGASSASKPVTAPTVSNNAGNPIDFGAATAIAFTNGIATVSGNANGAMRLYTVENAIISVTDETIQSTGSDRLTVAVAPGPLGQFSWTLASPQTNGVNFAGTNTLVAQDDWGNTVPTFNAATNNVTVTTSLPGSPLAVTGLGSLDNNVLNQAGDFVLGIANLTAMEMRYSGAAGTGTFTATSAVGSKTGTSTVITMNNPVPTLGTVVPGEASRLQTVTVALTGTNFMPGVSAVSFGAGITVDTVIVQSTTAISVRISIGAGAALGLRSVSVTNPTPGGGTATLASVFRVKNVPSITNLLPAAGIRGQTLDVLINGTNYAEGTSTVGILGSNITLNSQTVVSASTIRANITIGLGATDGIRYFTVTNSPPEGGTSNQVGFTVGNNPAPTLVSIRPDTVARLATTEVTLRGTEFYSGITTVNFGEGITVNSTVIDSAKQMRVTLTVTDTAAAGLRNVSVINAAPGGGTATLTDGLLVANPAPTLTGLSVQNGSRLETLSFAITGTKFIRGVTAVGLGTGITVNSTTVESATQLTVSITIDSSAALGARALSVTNPAPAGGSAQLANAFTVNNPTPTITAVAPESTLVGGAGLVLAVNGTNFVPGSTVRLGTTSLVSSLVSRTRIDATVPASELDTARISAVTVVNTAPGGGTSNGRNFAVQNPAPTLASIAPANGSRLQTLDVVFTGTSFLPGVTTVDFGGSDITVNSVTVTSPTELTANVSISASAAIGPRNVAASNPAPGGGTSEKRTFTIANNPAPTIATVEPSIGARLGKFDIVVTGTNFINGVTSVDFGPGIVVGAPVINSATRLTVAVTIGMAAATGPRAVSVTNAAPGGGTATKTGGFTVTNPEPVLISISPTNAQQLQTLNVVFNGSGFIQGVSTVNMGTGITVNSQTVVSDTQITANITVTLSAATGARDVWVTNLAPGGGSAILTNGFVVGNNPAPVLDNITPSAANRLETMEVVVRGDNFIGGVTTLDLGSDIVVSGLVVDSTTRLTATITVRPAAATGPRTVYLTNAPPGGGTDSIPGGFTVANPVPVLSSATPSSATRNQTLNVVLRGSNFINGTSQVNFGAGFVVNSVTVDSASRLTANVTIGANATLGARNLVVSNPAPGGGNSTPIAFTVNLAAPAAPVLTSPWNSQPNLPTTLTLRWDSAAGATGYHVQVSTSSLFVTMFVDDTTVTGLSRRIGPLVNNTTYYWRVRARNGGGTSTWSSTWSFTPAYPTVIIVSKVWSFPDLANPVEYKAADYQIVGLPGSGTSPVGNYLGGTQGTDWQLYWDNGAASSYLVAYTGSSPFTFSTGRAYWLVKKKEFTVNGSVTSAALDTAGNVIVPLHQGWNLITNPFGLDLPWSAVQAVNGQAAREPVWEFAGTTGYIQSATLKTYTGYYFLNQDGVTALKMPYAGTSGVLKQPADTAAEAGWKVTVGLVTPEYSDRSMTIGVHPDATDGLDPRDVHRPRTFGGLPSLTMQRPDMDKRYPAFAADIRGSIGSVARWALDLDAPRGKEVILDFTGIGSVPEEYEVYLVDHVHARSVNLRTDAALRFTPVTADSRFTVLVGTEDAVQAELGSVVPRTYSLDQNFPNPFNPSTTIPVAVPATGDVTVKVYSVLGEEIVTLHQGVLEQGRHWFAWDGKNGSGRRVATGMYLTRMTTPAGGSHVIKMLLMK